MSNELEHLHRKAAELEAENLQLKEALQHGKKWFFQIFHASSNPMAITTIKEGRIIDLNEANARFGGFTREELIGRTVTELNLLVDPKQSDAMKQKLQADGEVHNFEMQVRTKTGNIRTILLSLNPIVVNNEPCRLGISIDITEQKKEADALRESEEKYRTLVENSLQGLAIIQDSRIAFCNKAYAEIVGYSVEELLSISDANVLIHPDDHALVSMRYRDRLSGRAVPARYEHRLVAKGGEERWVEIYSSVVEFSGKPAVQCVFRDITERRKAAENLQKALDWQKAIFEGSRDAILVSDAEARFVDANEAACKLTGYSKEELIRLKAEDLLRKPHPSLNILHNRIMAGEDVLGETTIFTKDGREVDAEFGHRRVIINGVPYVHSVARNITNRKRLQAQFLQAQKMEAVGALAGGVAHDFNNLLSVIKGYTELLLEGLAPDDPKRRDLECIEKAGKQAISLTSQLLAFSRKQMLQPKILDLNATVTELIAILRRLIGEDIDLAAVACADLGLISADPGQVQQIIMNLAVNARDAMPAGGKLTIETANADFDDDYAREHPGVEPGPYVMLAISDTGVGMNAEIKARIFEPFFTTKGKGKGTGLGLSTVYGIVKQSKGFIWVYSEPGKGATFKTYFPREESAIPKAPVKSGIGSDSRGDETVLVVEDEASVRTLAVRILRERGYTVLEACDGKEAMDVAREYDGEIHLALTDVVMPGMSGRELVSRLEAARPGIKALYVSGYTDNAIVHHGILDATVAFLQKPFTIGNLARKVQEAIHS